MPERVVVATDGGAASHSALDWIVNRALTSPCEVELVTVEDLDWLPLGADRSEYLRRYDEVLGSAADYLRDRPGISFVATRLLAGDPGEELADAGAMAGALVIGSPRSDADSGALRGTLALRIAARTVTPLTVVPSGWKPAGGRVVVAIAEDDSSDEALDTAIREATRTSSELVLVHAWELPAPFTVVEGLLKPIFPRLEALHRAILDDAVARVTATAPALPTSQVLRFGHPATVLAELARHESVLVVGCHRRPRLERLVLGSVGHDVILATTSPVMVVPHQSVV
jgi:nucleotide-binding universal stress UspA family protein